MYIYALIFFHLSLYPWHIRHGDHYAAHFQNPWQAASRREAAKPVQEGADHSWQNSP